MKLLRKIHPKDEANVKEYIEQNYWGCLNIASAINQHGMTNQRNAKDSGDMYGYFVEDRLCGLFLFTNNFGFYPHFTDESVISKIDLLRAIKYYKPKLIEGTDIVIAKIWTVIDRTIIWYQYNKSSLMIREEILTNEEGDSEEGIQAILANEIDINKEVEFFIDVERHFGHNYKTVNQLKERITTRAERNEYVLIMKDAEIVAQGFVEKNIDQYSKISGIYTVPNYRSNGYGKAVTWEIIKKVYENNHVPILTVLNENTVAKQMYENMGFQVIADYVVAETRF